MTPTAQTRCPFPASRAQTSVLDGLRSEACRGRDRSDRERDADDAGGFEDVPLVGAELVELALDELPQGLGHDALERSRDAPSPRAHGKEAAPEQVVGDRRHEERVPVGGVVDLVGGRRVDRVARQPAREVGGDVVPGEQLEPELRAPSACMEALLDRLQGMVAEHEV
ncbi:MAG: hypothetical protein E6G33_16120, partial [Actinobacteria bacterium]